MQRTVHVNCSVHGNIYLDDYQQQIVATPHFQRLHRLKQLGSTYTVYPTATHTRFAHSLGVGHLAGKMYDSILSQHPELRERACDMDRKLVVTAGMVHDLGHGPHSHAFEGWAHRAYPEMHFEHEDMSVELLRDASHQGMLPYLDEWDPSDPDDTNRSVMERRERRLQTVAHMVLGTTHDDVDDECIPREKRWMLDIVSNSLHGIDVDKMDYLLRDTQVVFGSPPSVINLDRILKMARVLGGRICFHRKVALNLYQLLQLRLNMHQQVYGHKTCLIVELMLRDVLFELDHVLNIGERLEEPDKYMLLDDTLFQTARYLHQQTTWLPPTLIDDITRRDQVITRRRKIELALARALRILEDIDARRLYKCVASSTVDGHTYRQRGGPRSIPTSKEVYAAIPCNTLAQHLQVDDIIIEVRCFNYGKGDTNPMTERMFFEWDDDAPKRVKPRDVTYILPKQFSEYKVWVFCRRHDLTREQAAVLGEAFYHVMYTLTPSPSAAAAGNVSLAGSRTSIYKRHVDDDEEETYDDDDGCSSGEEGGNRPGSSGKKRQGDDNDGAGEPTRALRKRRTMQTSS